MTLTAAGPGSHDLLKILLNGHAAPSKPGAAMLLPFVREFVPYINIESNVMHICPPPGLMDLAISSAGKGTARRSTAKRINAAV